MLTLNGVPVIGIRHVPWGPNDERAVMDVVESRGVVDTHGGGRSHALIIGGRAIVWERYNGDAGAFKAYPVPADDMKTIVTGRARQAYVEDADGSLVIHGRKRHPGLAIDDGSNVVMCIDVRRGLDSLAVNVDAREVLRVVNNVAAMCMFGGR